MKPAVPGAALIAALALAGPVTAAAPLRIVFCAPGYPSNTAEAQPTMDAFARALERAAGWKSGRVTAAYHSTVEGSLGAIAGAAAVVVPLPFFLEYGRPAGLRPALEVEQAAGSREVWSLVARKGSVRDAADLGGWEIESLAGYSPRFVREVALAGWGRLPAAAAIAPEGRILGALRRAANGERVAALLDTAQTGALGSLPFASALEVVTRSAPLVGSLVCRTGVRLPEGDDATLETAFRRLGEIASVAELMRTMRVKRFRALDAAALDQAEAAFPAVPGER